jgi:hypothetical protein
VTRKGDFAPIPERFWPKVDQSGGPDACWPYTGVRNHRGYGQFTVGRVEGQKPASRIALELTLGRQLEPGELACHTCDNPPCCNPAHLWLGTNSENMIDAGRKGRIFGQRLSEDDVRELRYLWSQGWNGPQLSLRFGIDPATALRIGRGVQRRHVGEVAA